MANIKSSKKRILVAAARTERNRYIRSTVKTLSKRVLVAVQNNDKAAAQLALVAASKAIDKAVSKGVFHKNTAARKKSTLARIVNSVA